MEQQTVIFKCLINELSLKKAITYTFTGFLALADFGKVSGRFRVSNKKQSIEIDIVGNEKPPFALKAITIVPLDESYSDLLVTVKQDLDEASSFLDSIL